MKVKWIAALFLLALWGCTQNEADQSAKVSTPVDGAEAISKSRWLKIGLAGTTPIDNHDAPLGKPQSIGETFHNLEETARRP